MQQNSEKYHFYLGEVQDLATVVLNLEFFALSVSDGPSWRNHLCKRPTYLSNSCFCLTFLYTKTVKSINTILFMYFKSLKITTKKSHTNTRSVWKVSGLPLYLRAGVILHHRAGGILQSNPHLIE